MITKITEAITRKKLVKDTVVELLAKISGWMIATYMIAKIIDTIWWATVTVPKMGFTFMDFYSNNPGSAYGLWILVVEIGCGLLAAGILITSAGRKNQSTLWVAVISAVIMVCVNRWVMVLQVLAAPVLTFETWAPYIPSWQEVATTLLPVALGIIMVALSYRYLPIFPQEQELNPIEPETAAADSADETEGEPDNAGAAEPEPAMAAEGQPEPA
jgi:molybdopterin-containing oxidoreductase family membrane subunit